MFKERNFWQIIWSDLGVSITLGLLGFWGYKRSFAEVGLVYGLPYIWVNQ